MVRYRYNAIRFLTPQKEWRADVGGIAGRREARRGGRNHARQPESMQLRYLGTLANIAEERSSTFVFPLPSDLLTAIRSSLREAPSQTG